MKLKTKHIVRAVKTGCLLAACMMVVLLFYYRAIENTERFQVRENDDYIKVEDYSYRIIEDKNTPAGIKKEYCWILDNELVDDSSLAFNVSHHYVEVYIDRELVYSLKQSKENEVSKTTGINRISIPLHSVDQGKEVRIIVTPTYKNLINSTIDFFIGSESKMHLDQIKSDLNRLIFGFIAVVVGIMFCVMGIFNRRKQKTDWSLMSIGSFMVMVGIWSIADTWVIALFFPTLSVFSTYLSIAMLMFLMLPVSKYMQNEFLPNQKFLWIFSSVMTVSNCLLQLTLQIFKVCDIREMLTLTHITILLSSMMLIGGLIYKYVKCKKEDRPRNESFLFICVIGIMIDIAFYYIERGSENLIFTLLGFLFYFVLTGLGTFRRYREQEIEIKQKEQELAESRVDIMLSQIRPHFIYNTLATIRYLCLKNPQKAAEVVQDFSRYLRGNFGELERKSLIRLTQELNHTKCYTNIEKVRFQDIEILYDMNSTDFLLPALTIQPLVENAIKHGLMGLVSGGTVKVTTYETDEAYCVSVEDDGVGFDLDIPVTQDGRKHIGIANIRERLQVMCGGSLSIESTPGKGTRAIIEIPKGDERYASVGSR